MMYIVDTGSPVNVVGPDALVGMSKTPLIQPCNTPFYAYVSKTPLPIVGQFIGSIRFQDREIEAGFIVVEGASERLLSYKSSSLLCIIKWLGQINEEPHVKQPTTTQLQSSAPAADQLDHQSIMSRFKAMFPNTFSTKLGCLKDQQIKLEIDESVKPVKQKLRPIAIHLRDAVSQELDKQVQEGILELVDGTCGSTPWLSNLVVVPKNRKTNESSSPQRHGKIQKPNIGLEVRIICDSRAANHAIKRTRFPCKTLDDIVYLANGAQKFSKIDIRKAFHQMELAVESRNITTIVTHQGLYRYKRLHMGISCASEIFTEAIRVLLQRCPGQLNMTDDILVYGKNDQDHHENLMRVLKTLEESGLTLNAEKFEFYREQITFFGMRLSKNGIAPTEDRCTALREATPPSNTKELRSFLGTVQYSARFIRDLHKKLGPLWNLLKTGVVWKWTDVEQKAFDELKMAISSKCMAFFNKEWESELIVDASPIGLGSVLVQVNPYDKEDRRIVSFASRLLTQTEKR